MKRKAFERRGADGTADPSIGKTPTIALDGFCRGDGVQSGHDEVSVSEASRAISIVSRSRISPTRMTFGAWRNARAQGQRKSRRIGMQFALMDGSLLMTMQKLDGIFDGEYV